MSGSPSRRQKTKQTNLQTIVSAINGQRQSVSGVSVDEEMTNLINFQRGYQASAPHAHHDGMKCSKRWIEHHRGRRGSSDDRADSPARWSRRTLLGKHQQRP